MKKEWSDVRKNLQNVCFDMIDIRELISNPLKKTIVNGCGELWISVGEGDFQSISRFNMIVVTALANDQESADKLLSKTLKEISL